MKIPDWEVSVQFKNFAEYLIDFESLRYVWAASKPGNFGLVVPLNTETMDILRGSEVTFLFKGEEAFTGKITNKMPDFESGVITLEGLDWPGLMNERQISFMSYDFAGYEWAGGSADDSWSYAGGATGVPGMIQDMEGAELILLLLRHFTGKDINDTEFGDPTDMPYVDRSITRKQWIFEGETLTQSIEKVAKVMQASNLRFGYNFWVDGKKKWWLRRYGDQMYSKRMNALWSPPKEDVSTIINHLHFIGGIATPFPSDRESLTDMVAFDLTAMNDGTNNLKVPTAGSKGWGCWISPRINNNDGSESSGTDTIKVETTADRGFVTGPNEVALVGTHNRTSTGTMVCYGIYYQINNANADFRDENYPDGELRNWSDRHQLDTRRSHRLRTISFYLRIDGGTTDWHPENGSFKLKIYTKEPSFVANKYPTYKNPNYCMEEKDDVYELNLIGIFNNYVLKNLQTGTGDQSPWVRILIVFDKHITVAVDAVQGGVGGGTGSGIIDIDGDWSSSLTVTATLDVFSGETPNPEDIWGFGIESNVLTKGTGTYSWFAIDHLFLGFGEIEVERWDDISMQANRHVEKWIQDRKCHAWPRAEHLANVLLDSMKYAQKSRMGTLRYFNPELRPNLLIPIEEYGTEWLYVLNQIEVNVNTQGTAMKLTVGSPQPDPDELFEFYDLQRVNMESGGAGREVFDWVANSKCWTNCERYCQFACLSDWSASYLRGGSVCQTAREVTCLRCEMASELNPCVVSCLKYSQIAAISQRPPAERTDVDNTLLMGEGYSTGVVPEKAVSDPKKPVEEWRPPKCHKTREYY